MSEADAAAPAGSALRVLVAHNAYRHAGGEDSVVAAEIALLRRHGHSVVEMRRDNDEIDASDTTGRLALVAQTLWSRRTAAEARALIAEHRPQVAHIHNTLPLLSPSLHWACADAGVAVVQTLHNFRLACPQAMFLRDGKVCEDCLGRAPLPAVAHACYRGSRAQTAVLAGKLLLHRGLGTWRSKVDRFIALSEFSRTKFIAAGLAADRVAVKPNFVAAPAPAAGERSGFLFVGRLSPEKGIEVLAGALAGSLGEPVRVAGSGECESALKGLSRVSLLGHLPEPRVLDEMRRVRALLVPSICYETFGRVVVEAYACGLPVIASRIGSLAELVEHGVTGLLFNPGDAADLARAMQWAEAHPASLAEMGRRARLRFEARYTPEVNHAQLLAIYGAAIAQRQAA